MPARQDEKYSYVDDFDRSEFARLLRMVVIETWDGGARVAMDVSGKRNPLGNAHGGAIFALADHAFGIAANQEIFNEVAVSASIQYIAPAVERLEAVAEKVSENNLNSLYRVVVYEGSRIVAIFEGVGMKMAQKEPVP
jgi:uncharacterized domain 1